MKIEWIQAFCDLCNYKSFSEASEALFISRNALMRSIESLETELGVILFERSSKGLQLTEAGREIADHARELLRVYNDMLRSSGKRHDAKEFVLGIPGTHSDSYAMVQCIKIFNEQFQPMRVRIVQVPREAAEEDTIDGKLDYFFSTFLPKDNRLTSVAFATQSFVFLCNRRQYSASDSMIDAKSIAASSLILTSFSNRPQQILEAKTGLSVENNIKYRTTDLSLIYRMVADGEGIAMLTPKDALSGTELHEDLAVLYPDPKIDFQLRLIMRKKLADADITKKLTDCILKNYERLYIK